MCHPDYTDVDLEKVAVVMPEPPVKDDDGQLVAYLDILPTPCGKIAYQLAKYGYRFGISSRGEGDIITDYDGNEVVDPDTYSLTAFDLVEIPAVESARLSFTESLETKKVNKKTLKESLKDMIDSAKPEEKKVMLETLNNIGVDIVESKNIISQDDNKNQLYKILFFKDEDDINKFKGKNLKVIDVNDNVFFAIGTAEDLSEVADSTPDEIRDAVGKRMSRVALVKECITQEECADKEVQEQLTVENNEVGVVNELQEALQKNKELETKLTELQEKLSVCYAKEANLEEELNRKSSSVKRLSIDSKRATALQEKVSKLTSVNEELNKKFSEATKKVQKLEENAKLNRSARRTLTENVNTKANELTKLKESYTQLNEKYEQEKESLNESIAELQKDLKMKCSEYSSKIEKSNKLVEKYKRIANNSVDKYISSQALKLGVTSNEIKNRLPESYTFDDIDAICEDLQDYKLTMSKLPFQMNENFRIKATTQKKEKLIPANESDVVDDSLLRLAGLND